MKGDRSQAIRQYLFANGLSSVANLSVAVGTSLATLRRDLSLLETQGIVVRERGGARLAGHVDTEVAFDLREAEEIAAKRSIAASAFECIVPGSTIFLDSGTTVMQLARRLRMEPMPITIFTNCLPVAQHLIGTPNAKVILIGGTLRMENSSLVGPIAEAALRRLRFDQLFLGAGAVDQDGRISSVDEVEAQVNRMMIAHSNEVTLLVDSTKIGRELTFEVGTIADLQRIIINANLPEALGMLCREAGTQIKIAHVQNGGAS